jgi:CubicO group peptidase (beta-lactamase class C family)
MLIRCNAPALAAGAAAFVAWMLSSGTVSAAPTSVVPLTAELRAELDAYLEQAIVRFEVPGAAVALVQEGKVAYARGLGVRDLGTRAPVGVETRFMIGSLSKPLTALMAATLVDDGVLESLGVVLVLSARTRLGVRVRIRTGRGATRSFVRGLV